MWLFGALDQHFFAFGAVWVRNAAIHRADNGTLFAVEKSDTLRALVWNDVVDVLLERRMDYSVQLPRFTALVDCVIGAFPFARSAVDTFFGDDSGHCCPATPSLTRLARLSPLILLALAQNASCY